VNGMAPSCPKVPRQWRLWPSGRDHRGVRYKGRERSMSHWREKEEQTGRKRLAFRNCSHCGQRFWARMPHARFCSASCRVAAFRANRAEPRPARDAGWRKEAVRLLVPTA
jgi:hypothetical protein